MPSGRLVGELPCLEDGLVGLGNGPFAVGGDLARVDPPRGGLAELGERRLGLAQRGLEGRGVKHRQRLTRFDSVARRELYRLKEAGDRRRDKEAALPDGLDSTIGANGCGG